jgi:hypothetical protein
VEIFNIFKAKVTQAKYGHLFRTGSNLIGITIPGVETPGYLWMVPSGPKQLRLQKPILPGLRAMGWVLQRKIDSCVCQGGLGGF